MEGYMKQKHVIPTTLLSILSTVALLPAHVLSAEAWATGAEQKSHMQPQYETQNAQAYYLNQDGTYGYYPEQHQAAAKENSANSSSSEGADLPIGTVMDREQEMQYFYLTY